MVQAWEVMGDVSEGGTRGPELRSLVLHVSTLFGADSQFFLFPLTPSRDCSPPFGFLGWQNIFTLNLQANFLVEIKPADLGSPGPRIPARGEDCPGCEECVGNERVVVLAFKV